MATNDALMIFLANTVQENEKILQESCLKSQINIKHKKDYDKLFIRLNYICQMKATKDGVQLNSWCKKNVISYIYGPISGFPSGSWWGIRMDCSRDRVHDPFDENIQNGPFGVTSICTSNINLNEDVDLGNSLTLTGQKYSAGTLEKDPLIKNYENQVPVRLIRSYNLFNDFAPKTGYRYDGLYIVTNFWIGVNTDSIKYYKFALSRLNDQEPPSWSTKLTPLAISNHPSTLHSSSTPLQNCLKNSAPNMYEFKKYSHGSELIIQKGKHENSDGFLQTQNIENKKVDETKKGVIESAIVTRHVFKKLNTNTECTINIPNMPIMPENKSLTHIGNKGSKTHNTNISIRTGLYNSSHSTQNDSKKNTSSLFYRTVKAINIVKTNQHIENWNLSNKDKNKNLDGKTQTIISNEFPKRVNYISLNTVKPELMKLKFPKGVNAEINCDTNDTSLNSCYRLECNSTHKEITNDSKDVCNNIVNSSNTTTNMLNMTNCMYKNEISPHKVVSKELQQFKSIDSLPPDKIVHLINSKNHPLSKLLMGNMIGLTSEQSVALQTEDVITTKPEIKDKIVTRNSGKEKMKEKTKFEVISDDLNGSRCYKFRRRRKLSRKTINKSEILKYNKIHNEKFKKETVQSLDILEYPGKSREKTDICKNLKNKSIKKKTVQKRELSDSTRYIKKNAGSTIGARIHLQAVRKIDSSIKKHINKKKIREITNLLIDAKIGPKIRGPRYRRLRCINKCTEQSCEHFNTAMYTLNKCKVNSDRSTFQDRNKLTKITHCKRVKSQTKNVKMSKTLNFNHSKIGKNLTTSKKSDKNYIAKPAINNNNNNMKNNDNDNVDNNNRDKNKRSRYTKKNVKIVENNDITIKDRKRKLMQTICRNSKCNKINEELQKSYKKEISKPCKTDAVTQCSLLQEPAIKNLKLNDFVQNNVRNEQYTFIKIEYGSDFKDMKSEIYETTKLGDKNRGHHSTFRSSTEKCVSCTKTASNLQHPINSNVLLSSNTLSAKEQNKFSPERVSAFVPVNILDNDLKIARLRSIGFKPIDFSNSDEGINSQDKRNKVLKQSVTEKYNKYTNEENDIVVYMDDELQYQDIEDEDKNSSSTRDKTLNSKMYTEQLNKMILEKEPYNSLLEQDLESPWHGWKKIVTNKDTYWIGW
ncbi:MATH and LRR domain-containing protein PFE0570w [Bombus terrestris]|uniref:MATH and LRR domain-containing protein PFE0570w n=1 Tax=Bombus terrestris TaxID=30195 RepID=A0A9B0BZU5_BOMTE|nr:MATH and LRR domain-containing protein PFE0570w [Bombus terrestris]